MDAKPTILIFAGPNGAGKTTYAQKYLLSRPSFLFLNADHMARQLRAQGVQENRADLLAVKELLREIENNITLSNDFALETTLSGHTYIQNIPRWCQLGYFVELHYLRLPDVEGSIEGVRRRVAKGGHSVPEQALRRRFPMSLKNLEIAKNLVDLWYVFDAGKIDPTESGRNGR